MINYLLLALSTLTVSGKALLCKSLGVGFCLASRPF